jgi:translation initiation factor IF-2
LSTWRSKDSLPVNQRNADDKRKDEKKNKRRAKKKDTPHRVEMHLEDLPNQKSRRRRIKRRGIPKKSSPKAKAIKRRVFIDKKISLNALAHNLSIKVNDLMKASTKLGLEIDPEEAEIDVDTAKLISESFGYEVVDTASQEDDFLIKSSAQVDPNSAPRPPIVTIMGHVDHGKTTLLDAIRQSNVADGEAGGITQHISAYQVSHEGELITFIDTPGHEAFTAMRARGALVTDIVILVVAADDGVMPQTVEALNHAKAANVQIIVAINKCDKSNANPPRVIQELMQYELIPEDFGGETIFVEVSALQRNGIDDLLDNIVLLSEMGEYSAPKKRHAEGIVLEARLDKGRGAVATVIVKTGTLNRSDHIVLGKVWGRVRSMSDYRGKTLKTAPPSTPVEITGLQDVPSAGDNFVVVKNSKNARSLVDHRVEEEQTLQKVKKKVVTLEDLLQQQNQADIVTLNLILKSDVGGTLEALKASLDKNKLPGTEIKILHAAVGAITESDISLAHTYGGIVIGFNIRPDTKARRAISEKNVDVRTYKVIYEALEEISKALRGLLAPTLKEQWQGLAEIRKTFSVPKVGTVAGCYVVEGKINRKHNVRLLRNSVVIWEGRLASLQRFKDPVREVEKGYECGMNLDGFNDIKVGDIIETHTMEAIVEPE